jgi:hypothetical protein
VRHHGDDQADLDDGQNRPRRKGRLTEGPQPVRVVVERLRTLEDVQVADHVRDQEQQQQDAADRHDDLLEDRAGLRHLRGPALHRIRHCRHSVKARLRGWLRPRKDEVTQVS